MIYVNTGGSDALVYMCESEPCIFDHLFGKAWEKPTFCMFSWFNSLSPRQPEAALPGFGLPLNYVPTKDAPDYVGELFPNALSVRAVQRGNVAQKLITVRELAMLQFMNSVTDKPDWHLKVNNNEITEKWKDEVLASSESKMSEKSINWCIQELKYKAAFFASSPINPPIIVYNGDVVKSDTAVTAELKLSLQAAVNKFEASIPSRLKDWHPGSDEKVWDLVHPSLCPLVYGHTRILPVEEATALDDCIELCGQGVVVTIPAEVETYEVGSPRTMSNWSSFDVDGLRSPFSAKFQWLPCEVDISGDTARITSYINNLHPSKEKPLYTLMEKLIDAAIPLWNTTLAPITDTSYRHASRLPPYDTGPGYDSLPEAEGPPQMPGEDDDDYNERKWDWYQATRDIVRPEPNGKFKPVTQPPPLDLKGKYGKRGLQVIVKLANIELTPDKPEYGGGSWHVEGQMNEHIVATALYYYSCENITAATLSFRQQVDPMETNDVIYEQGDHRWLSEVFGCEQDGIAVQDIGGVETREGRMLTFPNILQHRVAPFRLAESAKPGHRKIVALFLVDPNIKIISTAHVPCQQQEWWWDAAMAKGGVNASGNSRTSNSKAPSAVGDIPIELLDSILAGVDFPISLERAKALRSELMEERKAFVFHHQSTFESATFSLCEH